MQEENVITIELSGADTLSIEALAPSEFERSFEARAAEINALSQKTSAQLEEVKVLLAEMEAMEEENNAKYEELKALCNETIAIYQEYITKVNGLIADLAVYEYLIERNAVLERDHYSIVYAMLWQERITQLTELLEENGISIPYFEPSGNPIPPEAKLDKYGVPTGQYIDITEL